MKYLLDTHTLLWLTIESENLSGKAKQIYLDGRNDFYMSVASIWEMAIKISLQKLSLKEGLEKFIDKHVVGNNIQILPVDAEHIYPLENLAFHHRDPFDRLLISQCIHEKMQLLSKDKIFDRYPIKRIW